MKRPKMRIAIEGATPMMMAPMVKRTSETMIVGFLPQLSEMGPANSEPTAAPNCASDTIVYILSISKPYPLLKLSDLWPCLIKVKLCPRNHSCVVAEQETTNG